jgi:hypothetical protein
LFFPDALDVLFAAIAVICLALRQQILRDLGIARESMRLAWAFIVAEAATIPSRMACTDSGVDRSDRCPRCAHEHALRPVSVANKVHAPRQHEGAGGLRKTSPDYHSRP